MHLLDKYKPLASIGVIALALGGIACSSEANTPGVDGSGGSGMAASGANGTTGIPADGSTGAVGATGAMTGGSAINGTITNGGSTVGTDGAVSGTDGGLSTTDGSAAVTNGGVASTNGAGGGASTDGTPSVSSTDGAATTTGGVVIPEPTLITSAQGAYWQVGEVTEGGGNATITVNDGSPLQDWHGFGGTFNEKGWDALKAVSAEDRDRAIRLLFDKQDGCGFTYGRIPIGSSDYGLSRYTLAETPNDFEMQSFSIERDRENLIPYIKAAQAVNPSLRFWASPWTPPPWMKDNNAYDRGAMKNDAQTLGAHALYLARFVEEYAKEGIVVEAIHPQNEPGYPQDYPSCTWTASQMTTYIATHLGPLFAQRLPDTQIWLGTMSNPNSSAIVSSVMGDSTARGYVKGIGLQWGMGDSNNPATYASQYQIPIMQTEHKCGNYPWETGTYKSTAPNDHAYAEESWGFFKNWIGKNVNSYMAWNMVLDSVGRSLDNVRPWAQNALLAVDVNSGTLIVTPTYWLFRHLAQYVEPGAVRVGTQGGDALAFKNPDGSVVTVMYNSGQQAAATTLAVSGTTVQFSIPARGWATVNWQG